MEPLETRYRGRHFRSRLEARWAVFFETLGLSWQYEPEGFDLGELGWYLPDFYVEGLIEGSPQGQWFEVKPRNTGDLLSLPIFRALPKHAEHRRGSNVSPLAGFHVLAGSPYPNEYWAICRGAANEGRWCTFHEGWINSVEHEEDGELLPALSERGLAILYEGDRSDLDHEQRQMSWQERTPRLLTAYDAAMGARFGT